MNGGKISVKLETVKMLGLYLNLILLVIAAFELAFGILFIIREKEKSYARNFIPFFTVFAVIVCGGYSIMGISPDVSKAFIPRFIGLWGVDALMLTELSFLLFDMNYKKNIEVHCYRHLYVVFAF